MSRFNDFLVEAKGQSSIFSRLLYISIFLGSQTCLADDFFGELSDRENYVLKKNVENTESVMEDINALQLMLSYSAFEEGRCDDYFEIESAAKKGDAMKQWILSDLYRRGLCVPQDDTRAFFWLRKAAEADFTDAFYDLGVFLVGGIGTESNGREAKKWLERAVDYNANAYYPIAMIYFEGNGVPQNFKQAFQYAHQGALYGDPRAQVITALLTSWGGFEFSNQVDAYKWGLIARSSGQANIEEALSELMDELEQSLTPSQIASAQEDALGYRPIEHAKTEEVTILDIELPAIGADIPSNLSEREARLRLSELGLERDRFIFFKAIEEDNVAVVALYVQAGASMETVSPVLMQTPLLHAAASGSEGVVKYLVENGVDIDRSVNYGKDTAVLLAISGGHRDIAEYLIEKDANLSHPGIMYNAVEFNDPELLSELRQKGVPIDEEYVATPLKNAISMVDENGERHCLAASAEFLLKNGARPNTVDSFGNSLVRAAIDSNNPYPCVKLLLENGASLATKDDSDTLFYAVLRGDADVVELLLRHGANANMTLDLEPNQVPYSLGGPAKDVAMNGGSILHVAVEEQHAAISRVLVKYGANVNAADKKGRTPISAATANHDNLMISVLTSKR